MLTQPNITKFIMDEYETFFSEVHEGVLMYPYFNKLKHKVNNRKANEFFSYIESSDIEPQDSTLYVHFPFCKTKCLFCFWEMDLIKKGPEIIDSYINALKKELIFYSQIKSIKEGKIKTLYFGGGTPSLLTLDQITDIFRFLKNTFDLTAIEEITYEFELGSITEEKISLLKDLGVTRMSCGWQTYDEKVRKAQGVISNIEDFHNALELLNNYNIPINIDLIYGLPGQTSEICKKDIDQLLNTSLVSSVDLYKCEIPPGTLNYKYGIANKLFTMGEREKREVYHYFRKKILLAGWKMCSCQLYYNPAVANSILRYVDYIYENYYNMIAAGPNCRGKIGNYYSLTVSGVDNYIREINNDHIPPLGLLALYDIKEISNINLIYFARRGMIKKSSLDNETLETEQSKLLFLAEMGYLEETEDSFLLTNKGMDYWSTISEFFLSEQGKIDRQESYLDSCV